VKISGEKFPAQLRATCDVRSPPNDQLTDGGPSVISELSSRVAGPPFGAATGSDYVLSIGMQIQSTT